MRLDGVGIELNPAQLGLQHVENRRQPLAVGIGADVEVLAGDAQALLHGFDLRTAVLQRRPAVHLFAHDIVIELRGVPFALPLYGTGDARRAAAFAPVEYRQREFHERRAVHRRSARAVGIIGLPRSPDADAQLRIEGRTGRADAGFGPVAAQLRGGIVGSECRRFGGGHPHGLRKRIADALRQHYAERRIGAPQDVEIMQRHGVIPLGGDQFVLRFAQARVDHQHVALGDIPLGKPAVHHLLERTDDADILPHRSGIERHGRKVPVGILGRIADIEPGELLVAEGDVVSQFGLPVSRTHGSAVDDLHQLGQHAEVPTFDAVVMMDGGREVPVERQPRQVARPRLPHGFCGGIAPGSGDFQPAAVLDHVAAVIVERGLSVRRRQAKKQND